MIFRYIYKYLFFHKEKRLMILIFKNPLLHLLFGLSKDLLQNQIWREDFERDFNAKSIHQI